MEKPRFCDTCRVWLNCENQYKDHLGGWMHKNKLDQKRLESSSTAAPSEADHLTIVVRPMSGEDITLEMQAVATLFCVKSKLQDRKRIPCHLLRLIYERQLLEDDDRRLTDYGIPNEGVVQLVVEQDPEPQVHSSCERLSVLRNLKRLQKADARVQINDEFVSMYLALRKMRGEQCRITAALLLTCKN